MLLLLRARERTQTHTHKCAHHVFYWIVSHFLLSEAYPPFLPLPSCSPPILSSRLPSSTSFCHSSASLTPSLSSLFFLPLCYLFFLIFSHQSVSYYIFFCLLLHLLSLWPSTWSSSLGCRPVWVRGRLQLLHSSSDSQSEGRNGGKARDKERN